MLQVLEDISKIATGTPIASLSASCDKVNSSIIANTGSNNWTIFDPTTASTAPVLRSLNADGVSYKYAYLMSAPPNLLVTTYESWNATTHVGTNQAAASSTVACAPKAHTSFSTTGGTLYIYASNNLLLLMQNNSTSAMVGEFSRDSKVLNATYPCHYVSQGIYGALMFTGNALVANAGYAGVPRIKSCVDVGDFKIGATPANAYNCCCLSAMGSRFGPVGLTKTNIRVRKVGAEIAYAQNSDVYLFHNLGYSTVANWTLIGKCRGFTALEGMGTVNIGDEITIAGVTYLLFPPADAGYPPIAVKKE